MNENNTKYADAAFELGAKYYAGNVLSQNYSKVVEYFQIVFRKVITVPETPELAANYFQQAADIDNSIAAFYIGVLKMPNLLVILAKWLNPSLRT
jgi:TPR repeat protein